MEKTKHSKLSRCDMRPLYPWFPPPPPRPPPPPPPHPGPPPPSRPRPRRWLICMQFQFQFQIYSPTAAWMRRWWEHFMLCEYYNTKLHCKCRHMIEYLVIFNTCMNFYWFSLSWRDKHAQRLYTVQQVFKIY